GRIADGAEVGGTALPVGTAWRGPHVLLRGPRCAREYLVLRGQIRRGSDVPRARQRSHRPGGTAGSGAPLWHGVSGAMLGGGSAHAVVLGLSSPGRAVGSGGARPGPGTRASL